MLRRFEIENYKSLHKVQADLPPFAAFVGANAAGKTNLADALEFLSLVARDGLASAITEKGGYENICFRRERRATGGVHFSINIDGVHIPFTNSNGLEFGFQYSFSFGAKSRAINCEYTVGDESLIVRARQVEIGRAHV